MPLLWKLKARASRLKSLPQQARSPLYVKGPLKAAPAAALLALIAPSHDEEGENTCRAVLEQLRHSGKMMPSAKKAARQQ